MAPLFAEGKRIAGRNPSVLITDGANNFTTAYMKEFYTQLKATRTVHFRDIRLAGRIHNNKMERLNEVRDGEKVMRSLKKTDTPILPGYQIYHNYLRPHMALNGRTPAEACGITTQGPNKWLTLIQNASRHPSKRPYNGTVLYP